MLCRPTIDFFRLGTGSRDQEYGLVSDRGRYDTNADQNAPGKWTTNQGSQNHSFSGTTTNSGSGNSFSIEPPFTLSFILCIKVRKILISPYSIWHFRKKIRLR